ncbi:cytochrome c oxidase assembly protein [Rhizobium sp. EC-SD404]|uniref:cytochrome c oxidase assembly protein n=1 Tax=Rhizobium sp. EC-SD404 TaxID=2038389 RepID=UPI0012537B4C|nr:cytochrome c oxidase assembly protein [Rhizobium sp. EC-SD404]VVT08740.1 CAAX protease [Rhizobium sp. EC-SD404]
MNSEVYCGPSPTPDTLWQAWNFDPYLLSALFVATGLLISNAKTAGTPHGRFYAAAAFVTLFIAFVSPLCALSSALFSARIFHHVMLIAIAAPLVALALPMRRRRTPGLLSAAFLVHTIFVWIWHAPAPYAFALSSNWAYWAMELTLLGSAIVLWQLIFGARREHCLPALAALFGSIVQMGMLGALLTFARAPLYGDHIATTEAFGLSPLADQQLAGILMWVPAALPYLIVALIFSSALVQERFAASAGHDRG